MGESSQIAQAVNNLEAIKSGEDPRLKRRQADDDKPGLAFEDVPLAHDDLEYKSPVYERSREEMLRQFVKCVNLCEPEHPYSDDPYPIRTSEVDYSYCKSTSSYSAKCGPRADWRDTKVGFSVDSQKIGCRTSARMYTLFAHELTHITHGSHSEGSTHNPTFWRAYARNAAKLFEEREALPESFDAEQYATHVYYGPNVSMTDRRMRSVDEQRDEVWRTFVRDLSQHRRQATPGV